MADTTRLGNADWFVLAGYFALLIGSGIWFSRRKVADTRDYFLANRSMPAWAVAISILATAQSAATFVGAPQSSYAGNLAYLASNIGGIIAAVILATVFIPAYYRLNVTTPYALLERRFGPGARTAASWAYLVGRVFASGARVFVGALPASLAIFGDVAPVHMCITIWFFIAFGVAYTFVGGVSSAIWTDVLQVSVYIGAALVTIAVLLHRIPVGPSELIDALANPPQGASKLTVIQTGLDFSKPWWGFDPGAEFTLLTVTTGFVLLTLASHGMDQDLVQRMLTCRNAAAGARSVIGGVLVGIPAVCIFLVVGLLLYVFYQRPDIMGLAAPAEAAPSDKAFQTFAYTQMGGGLAGLFLAGLFAAGPAGINSGLNSMASTFVEDVYRRVRPGRDERHYLKAGRAAVVAAGAMLGLFACACIVLYDSARNSLLGFVLGVMSFAYAGLLGMFFTALFTRRGSTKSVIAGWFAGFAIVALLEPVAWGWWTSLLPDSLAAAKDVAIAFPWRLVIATAVAFAVCLLGNSPAPRPLTRTIAA
jgi:SSS family transporter